MKDSYRAAAAGLAVALVALAPRADAQTRVTAGVRGRVVDEQGQGIDGVTIDMDYKGETRVPIKKSQTTDHKGGYVRMGVPGGRWRMTFSKPGYETYQLDTSLSDGGFSELADVVLKPAKAAATPPPAAKDEVVPVLPPESATMKDVYNKAVEASRTGDLDEAERLYKEILEKLPDLGEIHYNLGHVYVRKNDFASAEAELRKAAERLPQRADPYIALSAAYGLDGKGDDAADVLVQAKGKFEDDAKFQYALGAALINAGRPDEAAAALRKAIQLDPGQVEAHYHLASVAVGQNKAAEAIGELEKYLSMSGQDPQNLATAKALLAALKARK
jgi:tetratricopeptide (TPR) repeat protein